MSARDVIWLAASRIKRWPVAPRATQLTESSKGGRYSRRRSLRQDVDVVAEDILRVVRRSIHCDAMTILKPVTRIAHAVAVTGTRLAAPWKCSMMM